MTKTDAVIANMFSKVVANATYRLFEAENKTLDTKLSAHKPVARMVVKRRRDICSNTEVPISKCLTHVHLLEIKNILSIFYSPECRAKL
jgi:hypothetical protein